MTLNDSEFKSTVFKVAHISKRTTKVLTWQGDEHEEPAHQPPRRGNEPLDQGSADRTQGKEVSQKDNRDDRDD